MIEKTRPAIDVSRPQQRKGIVPNSTDGMLEQFQAHLLAYEPGNEREKIVLGEAYKQFNVG